jgi:hypothetical protein
MTHMLGVESQVGQLGEVITDMGSNRKFLKTPWAVRCEPAEGVGARLFADV